MIVDLRLSDTHGAEGLDLVSFVRRCGSRTPVLLLTAYGSSDVERAARDRGADAFLQKPIALSQLAQIVGELVGSPC